MIDNFSIFFTTALTVYICWRAARLDKRLPWFPRPAERSETQAVADPRRWVPPGQREATPPWRR